MLHRNAPLFLWILLAGCAGAEETAVRLEALCLTGAATGNGCETSLTPIAIGFGPSKSKKIDLDAKAAPRTLRAGDTVVVAFDRTIAGALSAELQIPASAATFTVSSAPTDLSADCKKNCKIPLPPIGQKARGDKVALAIEGWERSPHVLVRLDVVSGALAIEGMKSFSLVLRSAEVADPDPVKVDPVQVLREEVLAARAIDPTRVSVYGLSRSLVAGDRFSPARGADGGDGREELVDAESYFFFVDLFPTGLFAHDVLFVFVRASDGALTIREEKWWPRIDGADLQPGVTLPLFSEETAGTTIAGLDGGDPRRVAIVLHGDPNLSGVKNDADRAAQILADRGYVVYQVGPQNLGDAQDTKDALHQLLQNVAHTGTPEQLVIFYAGHGDERGWWTIPAEDGKWVDVHPAEIILDLAEIHAPEVAIVSEACFGGPTVESFEAQLAGYPIDSNVSFYMGTTGHEVGMVNRLHGLFGDALLDHWDTLPPGPLPIGEPAVLGLPRDTELSTLYFWVQHPMSTRVEATCRNGRRDPGEQDVDCGGICPTACPPPPASSCTDGVQNGGETGVDCGGSCGECECQDGQRSCPWWIRDRDDPSLYECQGGHWAPVQDCTQLECGAYRGFCRTYYASAICSC